MSKNNNQELSDFINDQINKLQQKYQDNRASLEEHFDSKLKYLTEEVTQKNESRRFYERVASNTLKKTMEFVYQSMKGSAAEFYDKEEREKIDQDFKKLKQSFQEDLNRYLEAEHKAEANLERAKQEYLKEDQDLQDNYLKKMHQLEANLNKMKDNFAD